MNYKDRKERAEILIQQDKYVDALMEYSLLFKENPRDSESIKRISFLWQRIQDGNYDFEPKTSEEYVMRGIARLYAEEIENSIEDFDYALYLDSGNHYALKSRAFSLKMLGHLDEAISDLLTAVKIQPTGEYYDDLSELYQLMGNNKLALEYHQKAIELSPTDARLWYNYGVDLVEIGNLKEALNKFNKAIELWPEYEDAQVNRQYLLQVLNNGK